MVDDWVGGGVAFVGLRSVFGSVGYTCRKQYQSSQHARHRHVGGAFPTRIPRASNDSDEDDDDVFAPPANKRAETKRGSQASGVLDLCSDSEPGNPAPKKRAKQSKSKISLRKNNANTAIEVIRLVWILCFTLIEKTSPTKNIGMVKLYYAVYGEGTVWSVDISLHANVEALQNAISADQRYEDRFLFPPSALTLYLARKKDGTETKWLKDDARLDELLRGGVSTEYEKMRVTWLLDKNYFGPNFQPGDNAIHVLVELPRAVVDVGPPQKKQRVVQCRIPFIGPLHGEDYAVSFDTMEAFTRIEGGFSKQKPASKPSFLLYGPRQFGKTSIAYHVMNSFATDKDLMWVFFEMPELGMATEAEEENFWKLLGACIDPSSRCACQDYDSFMVLVATCTAQAGKQLCLIVDEIDRLFANTTVAKKFLLALGQWKEAAYFRGFLGIGNHELVRHYDSLSGDRNSSAYTVCELIEMEPFSTEQMSAFFKLLEPRYKFSQSLQVGIMGYSSGTPGVFGSLVRFTADNNKWPLEWDEWEAWFKMDAFSGYLELYHYSCQRDLHTRLTGLEWVALKYILESNGRLTASDVERYCGVPVTRYPKKRLVDPLLRMGIVIQVRCGALAMASEVMNRVCVEALPEREIDEAATTDDPVLLLSAALRHVNSETISKHLGRNQRTQSELAFHHELYPTMRDILKKGRLTRGIYAKVTTPGCPRRSDILIASRVRMAYELKFSRLRTSEIEEVVKQADKYRRQFKVDRMLLVNFVPIGQKLDEVYRLAELPDVEIVHVRFAESCDDFLLSYLGATNEVEICSSSGFLGEFQDSFQRMTMAEDGSDTLSGVECKVPRYCLEQNESHVTGLLDREIC